MKHYLLLIGAMMALLLGLFGLATWLEIPLLSDPGPWLERRGPLAAMVGVGLLAGDVVLPVPSTLVMMAHGALFGVSLGTVLSLIGSTISALVGFAIGRSGGPLLARLVPENERRRADALLGQWGGLAVLVTRPIPIVAETVAILAGTSPMGWGRMVLATLGGALPASLLYALAGATAATFDNALLVLGLVLVMAGVFWAIGRWGWADKAQPSG